MCKGIKKVITILTSLAMVAGLFIGMKLDAKAGNSYNISQKNISGQSISAGDEIVLNKGDYIVTLYIYYQFNSSDSSYERVLEYSDNDVIYTLAQTHTIIPKTYQGNTYENYTLHVEYKEKLGSSPGDIHHYYNVYLIADVPGNDMAPHDCDFQWVTSIDPQCGTDGLEEYKCTKCGAVQESHAIPAGIAYVKDLYGKIKEAPVNSAVAYDFGNLATISDYLFAKMAERNDVTTTISFAYHGTRHQITFPAGTDYISVLTDSDQMYGFYGAAAKLGLTVTDIPD